MSPEQARRGPLDVSGDIYSLGVTLSRILAGSVAPGPVRALLQRMMAHSSRTRPHDMAAVHDELRRSRRP